MRYYLIAAALSSLAPLAAQTVPLLLVTGQNNHDWRYTAAEIEGALQECGLFTVRRTEEPAKDLAELDLDQFAAIVLDYNGPRWGEQAEARFLAAVERGTGVVVVHAANNAFEGWLEYERMVGLCWREGTGHGAYHAFSVHVVDAAHPITQGMDDLRLHPDELYHRLRPTPGAEWRVLLSAFSDEKTGGTGRFEPMATVASYGKGRVFHTPLGHTWTGAVPTRATWRDPHFRWLLARGTQWAATGEVSLPPHAPNVLRAEERDQGFALLFDGKTLAGWRGYRQESAPGQGWSAQQGAIVHAAQGGGGDLVTEKEFGDFDFRFEWRVGRKANSGVMWGVQEIDGPSYMTGPEYQILDDQGASPDPKHGAGALYDLVGNDGAPLRPAGAWNEGRIVLKQGRVEHWLNGKKLVDIERQGPEWERRIAGSKFRDWPFGKNLRGRLCLQDHGDEVAFRNLRILEL